MSHVSQAQIAQLLAELQGLRAERDHLRTRHDELERELEQRSVELCRQSSLTDLILNTVGEAIYGADSEDRATFLNPAGEQLFGYRASELIGKVAHEILHHSRPDGSPYPLEECPIYRTLQDGVARHGEAEVFWRKDGSSVPVEYVSTPMHSDGKIVGAVFAFKDVSERMRLWEALRESEAMLRAIFETATDSIFIKDLEGRYVRINPAGAAAMGHSAEEVLGKRDADFLGPEAGGRLEAEDRQIMATGESRTFEHVLRSGETERVYLATKHPFRSGGGEVVGLIGISRDITERKRMEEALREARDELEMRVQERTADLAGASEALQRALDELKDLYNHAPCGYHSLDIEGRIVRINDTELAWLGYERAEIVGHRTIYDLLTPESAERVRDNFPVFMRTGVLQDLEVDMVRRTGTIMTVLLSATVIRDAQGNYLKSRSTLFDITERKRAEAELRRSEASLANAQRIAHLGNWDLDFRTHALNWSDEIYRIFGLAPHQFGATYEAFLEHVHPDDREAVRRAVDEALAGRRPYAIDHRIIQSDGTVRYVHAQAEVATDEAGRPIRLTGTVQDVTDYRRAQEEIARREAELRQAQELDRLKNVFINSVSHDLRAPLMSILGYAEFLEDEIGGPITSQQRDFVAQIEKNTRRLEFMVNDLLDLARMGAGTFKLDMAEEDVRIPIGDVAESMRPLLAEARVAFELRLPEEPLVATVDGRRIERVVANLLTNAIKFTPAEGHITLELRRMGDRVRCEVSDSGIGIAPEDLPRLFQRFSQLAAGKQHGGTGLGLSISKAIIEAHGGTIGVHSRPGAGSTFWFELPLGPASRKPLS